MNHQNTKELDVRATMGASYCLRHRMLHFLQNFVYYMTLEVIGPRGHELETKLDEAEDMDVVLDLHERFLDTCLKECLLASQDLLKILTKLMTTCLLFADHMQRFSLEYSSSNSNSSSSSSSSSGHMLDINNNNNYFRSLKSKDIISTNHPPPPPLPSKTTTTTTTSSDKVSSDKVSSDKASSDKAASELAKILQLRKARIQESRTFIINETSHESFIRILNKFSDTFDEQVLRVLLLLLLLLYSIHPPNYYNRYQ